jgi:flagellar assembly protein FliH
LEQQAQGQIQQAYQQGLQEGEAAGARKATARLDPLVDQFGLILHELAQQKGRVRREAEQDLVKLSLAIARRILYREITLDPEALLGLVKAALDRVDARELHRIRLHAEDYKNLKPYLDTLRLPANVEVAADNRLERGAAVFETGRGNLDASVETQLREIERGFADIVRRQS